MLHHTLTMMTIIMMRPMAMMPPIMMPMMMMVILLVMMMMTIAHLYINLIERPSVDLTVHLTWRFNSLKFARHSD